MKYDVGKFGSGVCVGEGIQLAVHGRFWLPLFLIISGMIIFTIVNVVSHADQRRA